MGGKLSGVAIDETIYPALGRVVSEWSHLEHRTNGALWMFASVGTLPLMHEPSRVLMAGMALDARWEALKVLLASPPGGDAEALAWFGTWLGTARGLKTRRNDAIHSLWAIDANSPEDSAVAIDSGSRKARSAVRVDVVPRRQEELAELATEIADHHVALSEWTGRQFRRLGPPAAEGGSVHVPPRSPVVEFVPPAAGHPRPKG
jgi:hypothetical protein